MMRHHALMRATSPAESCHVMSADDLRAAGARVIVGRDAAGEVQAIGAYLPLGNGGAELKSMHCDARLRGQGAGRAVLQALMAAARSEGITSLWLETGTADAFTPARALYASEGFAECPPFGAYRPDPLSTFMTRQL